MAKLFHWIECTACGARTLCDQKNLIGRLRTLGMLRREAEPSDEMVHALVTQAAARLACDACGELSVKVSDANLSEDDWGDGSWGEARQCEKCSQPIPGERLEVFPNATRCATCQSLSDAGDGDAIDPEYCSRCGSILEMTRTTGSGISRYRMFCRQCAR